MQIFLYSWNVYNYGDGFYRMFYSPLQGELFIDFGLLYEALADYDLVIHIRLDYTDIKNKTSSLQSHSIFKFVQSYNTLSAAIVHTVR